MIRFHHTLLVIAAVLTSCSVKTVPGMEEKSHVVMVKDFGAVPDDGKDDIQAISEAIRAASNGSAELVFEAGVYDLFVGDASVRNAIEIYGIDNLTLCGATGEDGSPATVFMRHYEMADNIDGKQILLVENCLNFSLNNIRFDNTPQYMASGKVYYKDGTALGVELFQGCSVPDLSYAYCCNLWELSTRDLKHVGSVTFGDDVAANKAAYQVSMATNRKVIINSSRIARVAEVGDGISWHFGYLGTQVDFRFCDNLHIENIESNSAIGFHMQTSYCSDITAKNIKIRPNGSQLCAGSRDGWKLYLCSGTATVDNYYCEGVRWDGQNVHGKHLYPVRRESSNSMVFTYHGAVLEDINPGDKMGFWKNRLDETILTVKSYSCTPGIIPRECSVSFNEEIPEWINENTICNVYSHVVKYTLQNSEFRNIAGCASVIRNDNTTIRGNRYYNIMYPAILIGGETSNEGVSSKNAVVEGNIIDNCAWVARRAEKAAIDINVQNSGYDFVPYVRDVIIRNNTISNSPVGINAVGVCNLEIGGNSFSNCERDTSLKDIISDEDV